MAIFRKRKRIPANIMEQERNERLAFKDNLIPSTHTPSKEDIEKSSMIQQQGGFYYQLRSSKTYYDYLESPENRSIADFDDYMASRYGQKETGPVLVKRKTPPRNAENK